MVLDYPDVQKHLYHFVDVITTLKKSADFHSSFCRSTKPQAEIAPGSRGIHSSSDGDLLVYSGYLKAIDPITKSCILCLLDEDHAQIGSNLLILGVHIDTVQITTNPPNEIATLSQVRLIIETDCENKLSAHQRNYIGLEPVSHLSEDELAERRDEIAAWLRTNYLPVEIRAHTNEIIVGATARIKPPYENDQDFLCPSRIVLERLKHMTSSRNPT